MRGTTEAIPLDGAGTGDGHALLLGCIIPPRYAPP